MDYQHSVSLNVSDVYLEEYCEEVIVIVIVIVTVTVRVTVIVILMMFTLKNAVKR